MFKRLRIILLTVALSEAMVSQYYEADMDLDDKLSVVDPLKSTTTDSLVSCAILCGSGCTCFSFNSQTMLCLLFSSLDPSNMRESQAGWRTFEFIVWDFAPPKDCLSVYKSGQLTSGVYTIYPYETSDPDYRPVLVFCDMDTEGGGWTTIQRRIDVSSWSSESFDRNWAEYKTGFGSPYNDYWIGNDVIYQLTKGRNLSLYIAIQMAENATTLYQMYGQFSVSDEDSNYTLYIAEPGQGTLGDSMVNTDAECRLSGMRFSTWDRDNDNSSSNCAGEFWYDNGHGGWWSNACCCVCPNTWSLMQAEKPMNSTSMMIKAN